MLEETSSITLVMAASQTRALSETPKADKKSHPSQLMTNTNINRPTEQTSKPHGSKKMFTFGVTGHWARVYGDISSLDDITGLRFLSLLGVSRALGLSRRHDALELLAHKQRGQQVHEGLPLVAVDLAPPGAVELDKV